MPGQTHARRLLDQVVRTIPWTPDARDLGPLLAREWLVTNGIGGYASGTVAGVNTRRYHGLLVAALPNPLGRMVMCNHLLERVHFPDGHTVSLGGEELVGGTLRRTRQSRLREFRLEAGLPVWTYDLGDGSLLVRRLVMPYRQNTVMLRWARRGGSGPVRLELRPALHVRGYEDPVTAPDEDRYVLSRERAPGHFAIRGSRTELPPLHVRLIGADLTSTDDAVRTNELLYHLEEARGYASRGALWSPGAFGIGLGPDRDAGALVSTEEAEVLDAIGPDEALALERDRRRRLVDMAPAVRTDPVAAELALAADQFLITPRGRLRDRVRAQAVGDEVRTVIAGYHWFTDWGRDTMIALEGLTLTTGRWREAGYIIRTFAQYVRDGLIPNMFPDGSAEGLYHTADATLWFYHAVDRYVSVTGDRATLRQLLPILTDVAERHLAGTRYGIHVDPADGLLVQGAEGYQLTWMDAKCGDWVVTPRRGKAVEINALWYNALRLLADWSRAERGAEAALRWDMAADRVSDSFNLRFWDETRGCCRDVVDGPDGDDDAIRPNQLLSVSLPYAVLDQGRWGDLVQVVLHHLVTPYGLRSLAPSDPAYQARYDGDLRTRDGAYHQGTVWAWLIGPWVDAWLKVHPDDVAGARRWLRSLARHLDHFGMGSVAEIFDAEPPFTPRGCIAQAWSVAELLRCWAATAHPEALGPGGVDVYLRDEEA